MRSPQAQWSLSVGDAGGRIERYGEHKRKGQHGRTSGVAKRIASRSQKRSLPAMRGCWERNKEGRFRFPLTKTLPYYPPSLWLFHFATSVCLSAIIDSLCLIGLVHVHMPDRIISNPDRYVSFCVLCIQKCLTYFTIFTASHDNRSRARLICLLVLIALLALVAQVCAHLNTISKI
jgi:hypothetical protein